VSAHLAANQSPTRPHTARQALYDLDAEKSVTTIHKKKQKPPTHRTPSHQSERDGDSSDDNDTTDSASKNAPSKSFSTVGFRADHTVELDDSSDSSDSESGEVSIDDDGNPDPLGKGTGG
jgi:hypothetical protein